MDDLISRNKIVQEVVKNPNMTVSELYGLIIDIPTAYDVDEVVEKLEKNAYEHFDTPPYADQRQLDLVDAIEIVKRGGING